MKRRTFLLSTPFAAAAAAQSEAAPLRLDDVVRRHDETVDRLLKLQVTDRSSRWLGSYPDGDGLHEPGSASGLFQTFLAGYLHPQSRHRGSAVLLERIKLAADYLNRAQTPDGNVDLLITNFNSPPDTAFVSWGLAPAALLARQAGRSDLFGLVEGFLRRAGDALARGGVHTPNHRWVVCAALSGLYQVFPEPAYLRRIDEWLAEGIDIDSDGQFSERSTAGYNTICDRALVTTAVKLNRPELLEPVRKNLNAMMYLVHPDGEVVTEISHRQDVNTRGSLGGYWLPLRYLANRDQNGQFETLARSLEPQHASLLSLMEHPELLQPGPLPEALPDSYEKFMPANGIVRFRRKDLSATLLLRDNSRFFSARKGGLVVQAVRLAGAFFGKGQFVPQRGQKTEGSWRLSQSLDAGYYQPFGDGRKQPWGVESWYELRPLRERTEISEFHYSAELSPAGDGFDLVLKASGTRDVPVAVEISLREGGTLEGCEPLERVDQGFLLARGEAVYRLGSETLTIGPGKAENRYTQVRGAEPKLPGTSVYLTGYAPFEHRLRFRFS